MVKSKVKFSSVKFDKLDKEATLPAKFIRMLKSIPLKEMVEGKTVALKMHLGGGLCYTTIHPL
ncbi:MAG: 4Fe-4S ferredoxin, partial [Actinobacteria bacterium]|nr:4Fe-4S ferredoxin [Actinomycetota bacterium]